MLAGLGIAGDLEPGLTFTEDASELVDDVVGDFYVRKFHDDLRPAFDLGQAGAVANAAIGNPSAELVAGDGERPRMRLSLGKAVRTEVDRRKRAGGLMTYDDLVARLNAALSGPNKQLAIDLLRRRFGVVMVDEFQDTDPDQWRILRTAFGSGATTLVLIADPKQAIYGFRGADVFAYLEAAATASTRATLPINWRSDQGLVDAIGALLSGVKLGHAGIPYRDVRAAEEHRQPRLAGAPHPAPLRVRVVARDDPGVRLTPTGLVRADTGRARVVSDLADQVVALLHSGATISDVPVKPGDLAVLVRNHRQAADVRAALGGAGVPVVDYGAGSVFATDVAREWLVLLESLERPAELARARSAALTCFVGWDAERLARAGDDPDGREWEDVHRRLHDWSRVLRMRGVAALLESIVVSQDLAARVLADADGERRMTDLRHVGQLLHAAVSTQQLGATALTAWLRTRIAQAVSEAGDEERSRRLESDAEAVQVLTIHRSKGLEFPIVFLPFLWDMGRMREDVEPVFFHDDAGIGQTDVGLEGPEYREHKERFKREQRGEDLRLAYVALTRARHQAIAWWVPTWDCRDSPLARLLFARDDHGNIAADLKRTPEDTVVDRRFAELAGARAARDRDRAAVGDRGTARRLVGAAGGTGAAVDLQLRPRSRSALAADLVHRHHRRGLRGPRRLRARAAADRRRARRRPAAARAARASPPSCRCRRCCRGWASGSMSARSCTGCWRRPTSPRADLEAELRERIGEVYARRAAEIGDPADVVTGLAAAMRTPLGPVLDGLSLCDIARADRLDELDFELPLAGGDRPTGELTLTRIAAIAARVAAARRPARRLRRPARRRRAATERPRDT